MFSIIQRIGVIIQEIDVAPCAKVLDIDTMQVVAIIERIARNCADRVANSYRSQV
jgi:hypothetical protein